MNEPYQTYGQQGLPELGEFHPTYVDMTARNPYTPGKATTQYHIVIKRNDALYKTLSILNTILSVFGVLMVVATFFAVCYGLLMMSQVFETIEAIKNQNL